MDGFEARKRVRELGVAPGRFPPGPLNAITDIDGVAVGHVTLVEGDTIRTGATAILPHRGNIFREKVPAGLAILNGFGKLAGATQVMELGEIETPVVLTNTLAVGRGIEAVNRWTLSQPGNGDVVSINAVVGETNDSRLNDIRAGRPTVEEIGRAITDAREGPVAEGSVGAGTGTVAFGLKGGIGTSSRRVLAGGVEYMLGALVQSNYGGALRIDGKPLARVAAADRDGSIMIVLATDAPLSDRNLRRLAERAFGGLARTGAALSNGSGDYALAFSTAAPARRLVSRQSGEPFGHELANDAVSPLFEAAIEVVEEAILNSLTMATSVEGFNAATRAPNRIAAVKLGSVNLT